MRSALVAILLAASALPVAAAEPLYVDDRSDPEALIKSLYNAISRKEYGRAWSYFSTKPAQTLDAYAEGYADTGSVTVAVGVPSEHQADGTVHYYVPVAIVANAADGDSKTYAGCYELTLANSQLQAEDFASLQIVQGRLRPANRVLDDAMPDTCDDSGPPPPGALYERRAKALFRHTFDHCDAPEWATPEDLFSSHPVKRPDGAPFHLYRFLCGVGAYNEGHVYIMADPFGGLKVLSFAVPELDIRYEDDENEKVDSITVIGFKTEQQLVNSFFDPETNSITSFAKWRGIGDASSIGHWMFREGEFTLTRYDVDASYDGEIEHETIIDYHSGP